MKIGDVKPMGSYLNTPDACGYMMMMTMSLKTNGVDTQHTYLCGSCFVRLKEKMIFAYTYCDVKEKDAAEWTKSASKAWADAMLKANAATASGPK